MQPAYQDADSTALALQAVAPIGVTHFSTETLQQIVKQKQASQQERHSEGHNACPLAT